MDQVSKPDEQNDYIRVTTPSVWIVLAVLAILLAGILAWSILGSAEGHGEDDSAETIHPIVFVTNVTGDHSSDSGSHSSALPMSYTRFQSLSPEQQKQTFAEMTGPEIYSLVESSDENWPVTSYDLITPENVKETIVLFENEGDLHFNLAWPCYGGFLPESIASIGELSGTLEVSRDGGDSGHSMSYGRNADGSYPNDSQRSVPKSSASVRTGVLDVDRYLQVLDIVTNGESEESRLSDLREMGYDSEVSTSFLADNADFASRDEVSGPNNINDGAVLAGHTVEGKYGFYGTTAPWDIGKIKLEGGAGQLCTIFSWGTLCASGLVSDTGTAEIN